MRDQDQALGRLNTVWRKWLEHSAFTTSTGSNCHFGGISRGSSAVLTITGWFDGNDFNGDQLGPSSTGEA